MLQARDPAISACLNLTRAIRGARTVHEICAAALDALGESLGATRAAVLCSDEDGILRVTAWRELSAGYRRAMEGHRPWSRDLVGAEPVVVGDAGQEPSLSVLLPAIRAERIASLAFVPLVTGGRIVGALVPHYSSPRALSGHEIEIAEILAVQVALAFARTTAEEQARQREERLRVALDELLARAATTTESPAGTPYPAAPDLAGVRVLVVDDDPGARHLLEGLLGELGAAITTADSAAAAIDAFGNGNFDIMISDIAMPGVDGYQLVRHLRVDHPTMPAIALTAALKPADRAKAFAAGYDAHEPKPLDADRLLNRVHALIGSAPRGTTKRHHIEALATQGRGSRLCQVHRTDFIGEQVRLTARLTPPPATWSDEPALDAALFCAYHHLSGHWLHAFRGLLNGISLNLLVLGNAAAGAPRDLPAASVKTQLKELDSALTCWLDLSAIDETTDGLCDVVSLLERARSLVEPLARSRRIAVELSGAVSSPFCNADPRVLHALLVPALVNALLCSSEGSALRIVLEDDPSGILSVEVRPDAGAAPGATDLGFCDAARRALRIRGGDIQDLPDGGTTGLRLLLQRPR